MSFLKFLCSFSLCVFSSTLVFAQAVVLPKSITFTGVPAYPQADLLAFTGLKPGANSTVAEVQAAAQKINDTGLFADVHFESNAHGLVFALKPMPAANVLAAHFTNFVWWSPQEIETTLKSRVPLYLGSIPTAGNMQDNVIAALKAMLLEKSVTANVVAMPSASHGTTPDSIAFTIESPEVRVHNLAFTATSPAMQAKLDKVIKDVADQPFDQYTTPTSITSKVSDVYRNDGYLDIEIANLNHSAPQITPNAINVDLTATLHEGEQYRLSQLTWSGSEIMSASDFNKQAKLHSEDVASESALKQSLQALARAYYAKGFQDAKIQAPAAKDSVTRHVAYNITVIPGEQYRLHSVKALGLTDQQHKDFDSTWHMNAGDFYDVNYLTTFLLKNTAVQSLRGYSATYKAFSDPNTHLVDLVITFAKGGTLVNVTN